MAADHILPPFYMSLFTPMLFLKFAAVEHEVLFGNILWECVVGHLGA